MIASFGKKDSEALSSLHLAAGFSKPCGLSSSCHRQALIVAEVQSNFQAQAAKRRQAVDLVAVRLLSDDFNELVQR